MRLERCDIGHVGAAGVSPSQLASRQRASARDLRGGVCQARPSSCGPRRNTCGGALQFRPLRRSPRKSAYTHYEAECEARKKAECEARKQAECEVRKQVEREVAKQVEREACKPIERMASSDRAGLRGTARASPTASPTVGDALARTRPSTCGAATGALGQRQRRHSAFPGQAATQRPATAGTAVPSRSYDRLERCDAGHAGAGGGASPSQLAPRPVLAQGAARDRKPSSIPRARSAEPCRQEDVEGGDANAEAPRFQRERAATAGTGDAMLQAPGSPALPSSQRSAPFKTLQSGVFGGRFHAGKYLGRGASATVWEANHSEKNLRVAVKVFDQGTKDRRQALREMRVLSRLQHSSVLEVFEVVESSLFAQLVCEYIDGESLRAFAQRQPSHRLPEDLARRFYRQVVQGVSYCHERLVVHRDIKLENLLLNHGQEQIKIIDFGFAAQVASKDTKLRAFCGTPSYMAPEIIKGEGYSGFAADVWSLGVVLFALLVGSFPFVGRTEMQLYAKIRRGIFTCPDVLGDVARRLVKGALRVDFTARPPATAVLHHSWVTGAGAGGGHQGGVIGNDTAE